ncbi:hypothetical protein [Microbacterium ulmi]|uniref:Uncharacterized protein n=1 Tax=Microbacterium ulmi TaxID=179095 RepID=A0A7Y2M1K6_9MICO|nr:hypothetical protein [Microbacterium ulmi]NII68815.1 hypothetical protein [Microbacterium ulmi]NNH04754.1 hypothetical protein [Microbacterium ulmi]
MAVVCRSGVEERSSRSTSPKAAGGCPFRPDASLIAWLPAAVAGVVGAVALAYLQRLLGADRRTPLIPQDDDDAATPEPRAAVDPWSSAGPVDRRRFFAWTGAAAGARRHLRCPSRTRRAPSGVWRRHEPARSMCAVTPIAALIWRP